MIIVICKSVFPRNSIPIKYTLYFSPDAVLMTVLALLCGFALRISHTLEYFRDRGRAKTPWLEQTYVLLALLIFNGFQKIYVNFDI